MFCCSDQFKKGGAPSPFDRNFGTKISAKAMQWISKKLVETFRQGTGLKNISFFRNGEMTRSSIPSLPPYRGVTVVKQTFLYPRSVMESPRLAF